MCPVSGHAYESDKMDERLRLIDIKLLILEELVLVLSDEDALERTMGRILDLHEQRAKLEAGNA